MRDETGATATSGSNEPLDKDKVAMALSITPSHHPYSQVVDHSALRNGILELSSSLSGMMIAQQGSESSGTAFLSGETLTLAGTMAIALSEAIKNMHQVCISFAV